MGHDREGRGRSGPIRTYMWCSPCSSEHDAQCSFLMGTKENSDYDRRQISIRDRIRALNPRLDERERTLFGLVWLQLEILDAAASEAADWTLSVLETLVAAFEQVEAPTTPEPP
jgi:hypothetical protein